MPRVTQNTRKKFDIASFFDKIFSKGNICYPRSEGYIARRTRQLVKIPKHLFLCSERMFGDTDRAWRSPLAEGLLPIARG